MSEVRVRQEPKAEPTLHRDERELVAQVSNGDPAALELLYDRYSAAVCALPMRIGATRAEAEEITLETFLQLWKQAARFDPARGSLASWLLTMARNRALERVRSRGSNADVIEHAPRAVADDPVRPEWDAGDADRRRAARRAMAELQASQREPLELAYYVGLSYSEIAARTGESIGTIKSCITQAVMKLRTVLATPQG